MNFLQTIFAHLKERGSQPVLQEVRGGRLLPTTANELLAATARARAFLRIRGLKKGDRVVLLAPNSVRYVALDLALMAEGIIVVPLFVRETAARMEAIIRDCQPALICGEAPTGSASTKEPDNPILESLRCASRTAGAQAFESEVSPSQTGKSSPLFHIARDLPPLSTFNEIFGTEATNDSGPLPATPASVARHREEEAFSLLGEGPVTLSDDDPVTIIYTSGTSGEPKGVVLTVGNLNFMLPQTNARLDQLMKRRSSAFAREAKSDEDGRGGPAAPPQADQVFHYLPFCFAGSWILLLTCLSRASVLTLSTDLSKLAEEIALAQPEYFLNVPTLLERMKAGIEMELRKRGRIVWTLYQKGASAWLGLYRGRDDSGEQEPTHYWPPSWHDRLSYMLARRLIFPRVRKKLGPRLRALICGSAPLQRETQLFFMMLGLPVLQVYGLTETTAICTMDDPDDFLPGFVGPAIPGIEMRVGTSGEILVRGPNIFAGYWNRPEATAEAFTDGWFRTGDQGEMNREGKWKIIGRVKDLIVLSSGHNVAPEPIEQMIEQTLLRMAHEGASSAASPPVVVQAMVIGHGRSHLGVIVTGTWTPEQIAAALERVNEQLPSFKRIRVFHISPEPFTPDNGLLTANGKLRRQEIERRFHQQIEQMYR